MTGLLKKILKMGSHRNDSQLRDLWYFLQIHLTILHYDLKLFFDYDSAGARLREHLRLIEYRQTKNRVELYDTDIGKVYTPSALKHLKGIFGAPLNALYYEGVCKEVINSDCYGVRELAEKGFRPKVILDIGAQIGTFSLMATRFWPDARIIAVEPNRRYFLVLERNAAHYTNVELLNAALVGFFGREHLEDVADTINDTESILRKHPNKTFKGISVDDLFHRYNLEKIDLLKIDCEGSEVNIFREMDVLDKLKDVKEIRGEWHQSFARRQIAPVLAKTRKVDLRRSGTDDAKFGYFSASRIGPSQFQP